MELLSEIFLVTFSILYGIMLNSCLGLELFPFGKLGDPYCKKVGRRIMKSLLIINILPFALFSIILWNLQQAEISLTWFSGIGVFFVSMVVFAFYKIIAIFVLVDKGRWFYWNPGICVLKPARERIRRMIIQTSWKGHLVGCLLYFDLFVLGLILTFWESVVSSSLILLFASFFVMFLSMGILCLAILMKI